MAVAEFGAMFPDQEACASYLIAQRWPDGATSPQCGAAILGAAISGC